MVQRRGPSRISANLKGAWPGPWSVLWQKLKALQAERWGEVDDLAGFQTANVVLWFYGLDLARRLGRRRQAGDGGDGADCKERRLEVQPKENLTVHSLCVAVTLESPQASLGSCPGARREVDNICGVDKRRSGWGRGRGRRSVSDAHPASCAATMAYNYSVV